MDEKEKELEDMPLWQNHEQRITTLENTFGNLTTEVKEMKSSMSNVERAVNDSNKEQKDLLNTLIGHHLETNKMKINNFWKVILNVTGAGGLLVAFLYAVVQVIEYLF